MTDIVERWRDVSSYCDYDRIDPFIEYIDSCVDEIERLREALTHIYRWYPVYVTHPETTIDEIKAFAKQALGEKE